MGSTGPPSSVPPPQGPLPSTKHSSVTPRKKPRVCASNACQKRRVGHPAARPQGASGPRQSTGKRCPSKCSNTSSIEMSRGARASVAATRAPHGTQQARRTQDPHDLLKVFDGNALLAGDLPELHARALRPRSQIDQETKPVACPGRIAHVLPPRLAVRGGFRLREALPMCPLPRRSRISPSTKQPLGAAFRSMACARAGRVQRKASRSVHRGGMREEAQASMPPPRRPSETT